MRCPSCGCELNERQTEKGVMFLVCSRWPKCRVSGTPELLEKFDAMQQIPMEPPEPIRLGTFVEKLAQLRIQQSKLNRAKGEERERIRKQALESIR